MTQTALAINGRRIAGHNVAESLATLEQIEARVDILAKKESRTAAFRIVGNWLIHDDFLQSRIRPPFTRQSSPVHTRIPGLPAGGPISALGRRLFAQRVHAKTSASAIFFGSNLRAFYPGRRPLTLWIATLGKTATELSRASSVRSRFDSAAIASQPGARTTYTVEQQIATEPHYILEEMVVGRPFGQPKDWTTLSEILLPSLLRFYDEGQIKQRRAAEFFDASVIQKQVEAATQDLTWKSAWIPRENLLAASQTCLRLGSETLPTCTGHGDLSKTNLLVAANGALVLIDWEHSQELPLAAELIKLVRQHPPLASSLAPELRRRTEDPATMPPERQFLLATLGRLTELSSLSDGRARVDDPQLTQARRARKAGFWIRLASQLIDRSASA